jgi:hypothetical protein
MAIAEDILKFDQQLTELISRYERYFIGLEKREPLPLLLEVEKTVRRYSGIPINNTMYKHRFTMLAARLNTYREHWNRILKLMEDGKYTRDRFIGDLHKRQHAQQQNNKAEQINRVEPPELDRIFQEFTEARKSCHLPVDKITRDMIAEAIEKQRPLVAAKLGTEDLTFRVVIENGKPKLKAGLRKQ